MALLIGAHWEEATPGRAADALFLAIGIAATVSVWLQLRQWLGYAADSEGMQIWTDEFSRSRPSANLGQPNQLATLLVWGLIASLWGFIRKKISSTHAISMAVFILPGIALTQSRMAWIALLVLAAASFFWRRILSTRVCWVFFVLLLYFAFCTLSLSYFSALLELGIDVRETSLGGKSSQLRLEALYMFIDALWQKPWIGYGWNQLATAQMFVAKNHPSMTSFFIQSHNLFLDLMLWCGIPIGGGISVYLIIWIIRHIQRASNKEDIVLLFFLLSVGVHAMVEFPLHHAYFLLPAGLVIGIINKRLQDRIIFTTNRLWIVCFLALTSLLLSAIIRDYLLVDASFRAYRLEASHIGNLPPGKTPDVLILNDMQAFIKNARTEVNSNITDNELETLRRVTTSFPTPFNLFNYAKGLAYRHEVAKAQDWIEKLHKTQPDIYIKNLREVWNKQSLTEPAMAAIVWPQAEIKKIPSDSLSNEMKTTP